MLYHLLLILLAIAIVIVYIVIAFIYTDKKKTTIPFLPIPDELLNPIHDELTLYAGATLYDLGCGNAKVLRYCLKQQPTIHAVGVELGHLPFFLGSLWNFLKPLKNLVLLKRNFFDVSIESADRVFIYLLPHVIKKLVPKFRKELKAGTIIVACNYECDGLEKLHISQHAVQDKKFILYVYKI